MNKILTTSLMYILISMYSFAATEFNMSFSTVQPGGTYKPENVVVVWVTQADGTFVKTILRYANAEKSLLTTWRASAGTLDADAVLGATRPNHSAPVTMTATWDLKNKSGIVVPDGTYRINLEMTDGSKVTHSFNFVKDSTAGTRTDPGTTYFKNISIAYAPPVVPNTAPVAQSQSVTNVVEDTPKAITLTATDAETNALTYLIATSPSHGTLGSISGNVVTYTPATNYFGSDSFTFQARDFSMTSTPATVSITVTPVNDPPVAQSQSVPVGENVAKAITLIATDADNNPLAYTVLTSPSHGVLSGSAPNLTYTPATNYTGSDSFTFNAYDGTVTGNVATVSITVSYNAPPVANDQSVSTAKNTAKDITLTATDADGDPLIYAIVASPSHGTLNGIPLSPYYTYTPATNYTGSDSFTFSAFDGVSTGNIATVSITVTAPQYALTISGGTGGGSYTNGAQVIITANDPAVGQVFDRWTGAIQYVVSVTSSPTTVTVPPTNISLTATYKAAYYDLTVNGGTGSGSYTNGQGVTIKATIPAGWAFDQWNDGDTNGTRIITMSATSVIYTASFKDIQIPVLTISSPATGARLTNALVTVIGRATDNSGTADVLIRLNSGGWTTNNVLLSTTNWTADLTLQPGTNVFQAYARDAAGNISTTNALSLTYVVTVTLNIQTNGPGTVTRLPIGVPEVGKSYTLTAVPAKIGSAFSGWSGDAAGTNKVLSFIMASNMTITANFIDTLRPTVVITAPTAALRILGTNGLFTVRGTAADNLSLGNVLVQLNGGSWADAATTNGLKNWNLPVTLIPGTNTIRACSVDTTGNHSLTSSVACVYVVTGTLTIQTNGPGTVTRLPIGVPEVGKIYTLTAVPAKIGSAFSGWSGDSTSTNKVLSFTMTSNKTFTANFIDTLKPTVAITYPTALLRVVGNGAVVLRGTAADNGVLGGVKYQLYTGEWTNAVTTNVWKNWTAEYSPVSGLNTARVYSVDVQGNVSATSTVVFTYAPGAVMTVQANGAGTITPAYNGQVLEIGKSYIMTAKAAAKLSVFTNWTYGISGPVATNKTIVTFVMQSNLVLTANFNSLLAPKVALAVAIAAPATPQAAIVVDGSVKDWANVPHSSFSYASVTQDVAVTLSGNNIALLLNGCPFGTSDTVLVYFKLRLSYGVGDVRHSVDLWTSGSVLYGMVDGQVIAGFEAVLLNGVLEVKVPVDPAPSQVTIEEIGCGMDLGGGTLTELFKLTPSPATTP